MDLKKKLNLQYKELKHYFNSKTTPDLHTLNVCNQNQQWLS